MDHGVSSVEERLQQLRHRPVEVARDLSSIDPGPVWERGRTWQRRRRTGTLVGAALALALAVGVALAGWNSLPSRQTIQPMRSENVVGFPSTLYTPTEELPAYPRERAALAVVPDADPRGEDGSWGTPYAVSAETGAYGALDLPGLADAELSLSRDGRYLAYWAQGPTKQQGKSTWVQYQPIGAVVVQDLSTGRQWREEIPTPRGVAPMGLSWGPDGRLLGQSGRLLKGSGVSYDHWGRVIRWNPATGFALTGVDEESNVWWPDEVSQRSDGDYVVRNGNKVRTFDAYLRPQHTWTYGRVPSRIGLRASLSDGDQMALVRPAVDGTDSIIGPYRLLVADLDPSVDLLEWQQVGKLDEYQLLGWRGDQILVQLFDDDRWIGIDPTSGARTTVVSGLPTGTVSPAQDLLTDEDLVPGVRPGRVGEEADRTHQVAIAGGGALGAVVLVGLAVVVWRRRVHA